jgi:20S proteasome alpha/beta subunit
MTLIVGIKCQTGIVMGADGAATFGVMGQQTIRQTTKKLEILEGAIILGTSGFVGLGQRVRDDVQRIWNENKLAGKNPTEAMRIIREAMLGDIQSELQMASLSRNVVGPNVAAETALCATMMTIPVKKEPCLFHFNHQCSVECVTNTLPFVALGSGQTIADPFLAFIRRIFWPDCLPPLADGIFAALWTLKHAIDTAPGGISGPMQVAILEKNSKAYELPKEDEQEHLEAIENAEKHLAAFRDTFKPPAPGEPSIKIPEPPRA